MAETTMRLSAATRNRIRALGGASDEATIVEAVDLLEAERFWSRAIVAVAWRRSLSDAEQGLPVCP